MLPPGHIAAGYLTAGALIAFAKPPLTPDQLNQLLWLGAFFGFAPDLDMFYAFWKERGFRQTGEKFNHRQFISHAPIVWLVAGIIVAGVGHTAFWFFAGLTVWLSAWSHLLLDSSFYGIRWLYPFSKKFYALKNAGVREVNPATGFFKHWWHLVIMYYERYPSTFFAELLIIALALLTFFSGSR